MKKRKQKENKTKAQNALGTVSTEYTIKNKLKKARRSTMNHASTSCFGPHIWNSLPQDLRHCSTLSSFKAKLKTFLFSQYFHPN